jgi:hypothetical protein
VDRLAPGGAEHVVVGTAPFGTDSQPLLGLALTVISEYLHGVGVDADGQFAEVAMNANIGAIVIAAVGVLGTLAGTIVSQLLSTRARKADFEMQRERRKEEYFQERQKTDLANKRSCYIAMMASSRRYRVELMNYAYAVKEQVVDDDARHELENSRRACLDSIAEVQIVATLKVLDTIDPVNSGLSRGYRFVKRLEAGEPEPNGSFEEIERFLTKLWDKWRYMREAMRQDLGVED